MSATESSNKTERTVVGVDGSDSSKKALAWAAEQARLTGTTLAAVAAWYYPPIWGRSPAWPASEEPAAETMGLLLDTLEEVLGSEPGITLTTTVVEGHPAPALVEESKTASLLVVGSRGHGEFGGMLLGSVSQFVIAHAHCPVVVVRS